jgi:hypothetical protein
VSRRYHSTVWAILSAARDNGDIGGFDDLGGGRWRIEVPATRYAAYHGEQWGSIVLRTREALAWAEGYWSGRRVNPTTRAGAGTGSAIRDFEGS